VRPVPKPQPVSNTMKPSRPVTPRPSLITPAAGCVLALALVTASVPASAGDSPQWRGPARDGSVPESGLLKEWAKDGPKLAWQSDRAGSGYGAPAVVGDRVYVVGNDGMDNEFVRALAVQDGKPAWELRLGKVGNPDQKPEFPGARTTPTVAGDTLYALGSDGDLVAVETATGKARWTKNLRTDFGGKPGMWAYSESPLVDGDVVVATPGGADASLVALNRQTGAVVWKAAVPGVEAAAYSSALVAVFDGTRQYVQMLDRGLVGLDAKTGALLWRYDRTVSKFRANIPTPVIGGDAVYSAGAGTGGAVVHVKKTAGGFEAAEGYFSAKLPTAIGGSVLVGKQLYGTTTGGLLCVDFGSGEVKWEERALGAAALCFADGRLYLAGENGEVALVEPATEGYREKGRFSPPGRPARKGGMERAWAYPVVANGKLYLRDHAQVWCYDVKG